jgi:hypothetical protein
VIRADITELDFSLMFNYDHRESGVWFGFMRRSCVGPFEPVAHGVSLDTAPNADSPDTEITLTVKDLNPSPQEKIVLNRGVESRTSVVTSSRSSLADSAASVVI